MQYFAKLASHVNNLENFNQWNKVVVVYSIFLTSALFGGGGHNHGSHSDHESDGLVRISDVGLDTSGIEIKKAKSQSMQLTLEVNGYLVPNEYQTSHLRPRYSGVVKKVHVQLGQQVKKGQILATIQANDSETNFLVKASFPGTIIEKDIIIGQFVSIDHEIFQISNLESVWVELSIPENAISKVEKGMDVLISSWNKSKKVRGKISYLSSNIYKDSQSIMARVELDNKQKLWRPGTFAKAIIFAKNLDNILSIEKTAIQTLDNESVIFIEQEEGIFKPQPIKLGRRNETKVEVLDGLNVGDRYVAKNSYILKADLLKSEASHEH